MIICDKCTQKCQFFLSQEAALKTFHISDDPKNYYVTEICETGEGERERENESMERERMKEKERKRMESERG